jgi:hypothetical protein
VRQRRSNLPTLVIASFREAIFPHSSPASFSEAIQFAFVFLDCFGFQPRKDKIKEFYLKILKKTLVKALKIKKDFRHVARIFLLNLSFTDLLFVIASVSEAIQFAFVFLDCFGFQPRKDEEGGASLLAK